MNAYASFVQSAPFPQLTSPLKSTTIDSIVESIISTKCYRYGPRPDPTSINAITAAVSSQVATNQPILFICPWGSEKPVGGEIDLAELFSLRSLSALNDRIRQSYSPGAQFKLRMEDTSAPHLFFDRQEQARADAKLYLTSMRRLIHILTYDFISVTPESEKVSEEDFNRVADFALPHMENIFRALPEPHPSSTELRQFNWFGCTTEQKVFYLVRYQKLYPSESRDQHLHRIARYFAGVFARKLLGLSGAAAEANPNHLELYFSFPFVGDARPKRIHYRTMPQSITSSHIPPWRGKGYIRVTPSTPHITMGSFSDPISFTPNHILFTNNQQAQLVRADYTTTQMTT